MALQAQTRRTRQASPERWQKAARRAVDEGIQVRQVNTSGIWVANSGTQANVAYMLEIARGVVQSCTCPAGDFGDPCCKHAARYYLDAGVLTLDDPEPDPPAPLFLIDCQNCHGCGVHYRRELERAGVLYPTCAVCGGSGQIAA